MTLCQLFIVLIKYRCSSDRLTDEAISIAIATKENLSHQRGMFSGAAGRMGAVACILNYASVGPYDKLSYLKHSLLLILASIGAYLRYKLRTFMEAAIYNIH
jgi:hypothetical protein